MWNLERLGTRNYLYQLLRDHGLARAIISERQAPDHVAGIARGIIHGTHARALLRCCVLEQSPEDLRRNVEWQEVGEDFALARLVFIDRAAKRGLRRGGFLGNLGGDDAQGGGNLGDQRWDAREEAGCGVT